jgi:hypothetical protein
MIAKLPCSVCLKEAVEKSGGASVDSRDFSTWMRLQTDLVFFGTCKHGHNSAYMYQLPNYAILMDLGAYAIIDGYNREAVANAASALERLYEYYIKAVCRYRGIEAVQVEKTWKKFSKSSERQLGAFCSLYLLETKNTPEILDEKNANVRNDVVHKGVFPGEDITLNFYCEIYRIMNILIKRLSDDFGDANMWIMHDDILRLSKVYKSKSDVTDLGGAGGGHHILQNTSNMQDERYDKLSCVEKIDVIRNGRFLYPDSMGEFDNNIA